MNKEKIYTSIVSGLLILAVVFTVARQPAESGLTNASYDATVYEPYITPGTSLQYLDGTLQWQTLPVISALSFNNAASHTIQTVAASANGFQLSTTRNVSVYYSVNVTTTATIAGASDGYVVLEICPTNSAVAANWTEVSRSRNGQTISLAIVLQSVQNIGSELMNIIPAGYYMRLRSVNVSGTPTYSFISGQEVTL